MALASAAGVAIENARLHERVSELRVIEDRERIARDLHDTVIQRLFATGLALQSVAGRVGDPELSTRLEAAVDDRDTTVREIRTTIFDLQRRRIPGRSLRQDVLEIVHEAANALGFRPTVRFDGAIDMSVPDDLAANVTATVREALTNVVRHAEATRVDLSLTTDGDRLTLEVADDGVGLPEERPGGGNGLRNMGNRAEELGGSMTVTSDPDARGTRLRWSAQM